MSSEPPQGGDSGSGADRHGPGEPAQGPHGQDPQSQDPYAQQPYPQQPYGQSGDPQYGRQPYGEQQHGEQQYGQQQPYGGQGEPQQYGGPQPYGGQPYPGGAYGGQPYPGGAGHGPPTGSSPDPLVPFSFGDWASKIVGTVGRSWKTLAIIQLCALLPVAIISAIAVLVAGGPTSYDNDALAPSFGFQYAVGAGGFVLFVVAIVLGALAQAASVFVIVRDAAGRPWSRDQVIAFARNRALPIIGWTILSAIIVGIGFVLLVIPGIYLSVVVGGALTGVVVVERAGIGRCFRLVNPRWFPVFGRLLVLVVLGGIYGIITSLIAGGVGYAAPALGQIVYNLLMIPAAVVGTAASIVTYAECRFHEHNPVHTPVLADEIDRA
ncbi:hypothetical protein [Pseudonocardia phyllosphaerae]|uniref:hypothetical protein n=1 Tax=Pseudonocardia phyllosphaerae TaxID=3390502 RepID=UPI003978DD4E